MHPEPARSRRHGFSLVELIGVLSVIAIMAATAAPAVRALGETRSIQVAGAVEHALRHARASAVGLGAPCGVRTDQSEQTIELITLENGTVVPMVDLLGRPVPADRFDPSGAVEISSVTGGSTSGRVSEIWFDETGGHASVTGSGTVTELTRDAVIALSTGRVITVRGTSGLIE